MKVIVMHRVTESTPDDPEFAGVLVFDTDADDEAALADAFERTQNLDQPWNPEAPWQRSTEEQDVISCDARMYIVASVTEGELMEPATATFERIHVDADKNVV